MRQTPRVVGAYLLVPVASGESMVTFRQYA